MENVYGNFVANSVLPKLSLISYAPPIAGFPGNDHTLEAYAELPFVAGKIYGVSALGTAASENSALGNWLVALSKLGTPLSGTIALRGEGALAAAGWQGFVAGGAEIASPIGAAGIIAATIQDAYVWFHCW